MKIVKNRFDINTSISVLVPDKTPKETLMKRCMEIHTKEVSPELLRVRDLLERYQKGEKINIIRL